jgi:DNA-binding IclR family transcriptional regulator
MVPIEVVEPERAVRLASPLGAPLPLHCTAAGKALLAFEGEDELKSLLPDGFAKHTERTPTDRAALMQQLKSVATSGYAIDMGEYVEDVRAVAVPIRDYARTVVATLAVAGPAYRFQAERIEKELAPLVSKAGREISSRLGFDLGRREA